MLPALATGTAISIVNVVLHSSSLLMLRKIYRWHIRRTHPNVHEAIRLALIMASITTMLLFAHLAEITIWGTLFWALSLAASWHTAFYDAFLSYTSLGFTMPAHQPWRLLEPISTLNGILLAGLSTAVMFNVLGQLLTPTVKAK